jgi:hypothetical protein
LNSCQNGSRKIPKISRVDSIKNSLLGKWGGPGEDSPVTKITYDSIHNFQEKKSYAYTIIGNDLVFDNGQSKSYMKNISVTKDTLSFEVRVSLEKEIYMTVRAIRFK